MKHLSPSKIAIIYTLFGGLWILFSDLFIELLVRDMDALSRLQTYKGWFFILVTAFMLYLLIKGYISEIRQAERALRDNLQFMHTLLDTIPNPVFYKNAEGAYQGCNVAFADKILGLSKEEIIGKSFYDFSGIISPDMADRYHEQDMKLLRGASFQSYEVSVRCADSVQRDFVINKASFRNDTNEVACIVGVMSDITELKQAEAELKKSNALLKSLINSIPDLIFYKTPDSVYLGCNNAFSDFVGRSSSEIIGKTDYDFFPPEQAAFFQEMDRQMLASGKSRRIEEEVPMPNGGHLPVETMKTPYYGPEGELLGLIGVSRDITERKKAEKALRLNEARLEALLKLSRMNDAPLKEITAFFLEKASCLTKSQISYLALVNKSETELTLHYRTPEGTYCDCQPLRSPVEEAGPWGEAVRLQRSVLTTDSDVLFPLIPPETGQQVRLERHADVPIFEGEHTDIVAGVANKAQAYDDSDMRQLTLLLQGMWQLVCRKQEDEDKKRLEMQLRQAQKMESLGTLAGGIAHDFNNILSAILGYTEITVRELPDGSQIQENLKRVLSAGERATDLVRQILTFSRQTEHELKAVRIKPILKEVLKLLRASLPTTIDIRYNIESEAEVMADPTQIHQVIMNLCTNAAHAMRDLGGVLAVELTDVSIGPDYADRYLDITPGNYLRLTVSDSGCGIPPEILDRIFEPFFTTKEKEEGTGMGLAMVHGIIRSYGGMITVYSEAGQGTTFNIFIPEIEKRAAAEAAAEAPLLTGTGRILFVDDEPFQVDIGTQILEFLGYEVVATTSSPEALELFEKSPDRFDLVITDMTMPRMTGEVLAEKIIEIRPHMPIILCSGYSEGMTEEKARSLGIREFALKPIVMKEIARIIRKVLD